MPATYLILFAVGLGIIWFGLRTKDEVYRLAATITAAILLIWGFVLTPLEFQLVVGILAVVAVFPICVSCINE